MEFLKEGTEPVDKAQRRERDLELWRNWHTNGQKPEDLRPLFTQFRPTLRKQVNMWANRVEVPPVAIQAEFNKQFVKALQTYDPSFNRPLNNWITDVLRKGNRWVGENQNIARIPEARSHGAVREFKTARSQLNDSLGREPTHIEIAENLGWAPKQVELLEKELRKSHVASGFDIDPVDLLPSVEKEAIHNVFYELTPEEQIVYDYTLGAHGKPELKPMQIAKQLGYSGSKVTRLRNSITEKLKKHL